MGQHLRHALVVVVEAALVVALLAGTAVMSCAAVLAPLDL
jgi:hypothetical protein